MTINFEKRTLVELKYARMIANFASSNGFIAKESSSLNYPAHLGAVMADSILQAGVNYRTVVQPRISAILQNYPKANNIHGVSEVVQNENLSEFLNWRHFEKIDRFRNLANMFEKKSIITTGDLKNAIDCSDFRGDLLALHGIGKKTIDYMANLVGLESIAVDRHVKSFAVRCGLHVTDYDVLKRTFCFAADLLDSNRSHFDAWVWNAEANKVFAA